MLETDFHVAVGASVHFSKTVSESDVYLFAGITGDLSDVHCNEEFMKKSAFRRRIAHGALSVGFMSTASTLMFTPHIDKYVGLTPVSQGYDRVRFVGAVYFGDTLTITYTIAKLEGDRCRALSEVVATNQNGETVATATHIMRWIPVSESSREATS